MPSAPLEIRRNLVIPSFELNVQVSSSGGPGGQHANKTSTKVTLRWTVRTSKAINEYQRRRLLEFFSSRLTQTGEIVLHASDSRSQSWNHECARSRLVELILEGLKPLKKRKATRPTRGSVERRLKKKKQNSQRKKDRQKKRYDD